LNATALAAGVWPHQALTKSTQNRYHGRDVHVLNGKSGTIIVDAKTGHYWVKRRFVRDTFDPNGRALDRKYYWGSLLKMVDGSGWIREYFGAWVADIAAGAMIFFGLTGVFMYVGFSRPGPEGERRKTPMRSRVKVVDKKTPRPQRIKLKS